MKSFIRKFAAASGSIALAAASVPAIAQDGDTETKPEVYDLLIDCGTANFIASTGTEDATQVADYEGKATAFFLVGKAYGEVDAETLKADGAKSFERVQKLIDSKDDAKITEFLSSCIKMEETVMEIHSGM